MPRRKVPESPTQSFFITARCINRDWFRIPIDEVWTIFSNYLYLTKHAFEMEIVSFILMSNHFHLIAKFPRGNRCLAMNYLMREVSKEITRASERINQTFGGPYHACLIKTDVHYRHAYKYCYRNSVKAKICAKVQDYPYSTLHGKLGGSKLIIPVTEDFLLFSDTDMTLDWLNETYDEVVEQQIQKALRRSEFQFVKVGANRKKNPLDSEEK